MDFLIALVVTTIVAAFCYPFQSAIGYQTVGLIFLITISVLSLFLGRAALIFMAILNFTVWNFFFIQPLYTFRVHSIHDLIALFANLVVALAASALISRIRKSQRTLQASQENMILIHGFLESLNNSTSIKEVVKRAQESIRVNFMADIVVYLINKTGKGLDSRPFGDASLDNPDLFHHAERLFEITESDNLPREFQNVFFYPLKEPRTTIGLIGIKFRKYPPEKEKLIMLQAFISQIASALDREISIDKVKVQEISAESEKLFQTVLNSVSHELKTPIAIISASVSNLNDDRMSSQPEIRRQIGEELEIAARRMNHLVVNILDMSRLDSGLLKLNLQVCDVADLIGIVVNESRKDNHEIRIITGDNIPFIRGDINLLKQALLNILHNALIYSPPFSVVTIEAIRNKNNICISVKDEGPGIDDIYISRVFEKFYRVPGTKSGGTGLGLPIARAICELHGGTVTVTNQSTGGICVTMYLKTAEGES